MIDITLDDGTILDIETDDPAQVNAAAWNYLTDRARAQSATSLYPPEFLPPQQPGAALGFAAPTGGDRRGRGRCVAVAARSQTVPTR
jgi:hypothetical protein